MDDLISRRAAIEAVHKEFDECLVWDESGKYTADEVERVLTDVPSAPNTYNALSALDCVDRQAAIDLIAYSSDDLNDNEQNWDMREEFRKLPSVQPQRWIPVTERLPEHSGFYIVTAIVTDDGGKLVGLRWFSQEHGWKFGKNPLAWMPLPEPYKEKKNETD